MKPIHFWESPRLPISRALATVLLFVIVLVACGSNTAGTSSPARPCPSSAANAATNSSPIPLGDNLTEFPVGGNQPGSGLIDGPDGNLWFITDSSVGRITPTGTITQFPVSPTIGLLDSITEGSDGNLWFNAISPSGSDAIGRITPTTGTITQFPVSPTIGHLTGMTAGPDGNVWFTSQNGIGHITPTGAITDFPLPTNHGVILGITAGPDGNVWFTSQNGIGRIALTTGMITEFSMNTLKADLSGITSGPNDTLWVREQEGNTFGRIEIRQLT